MKLSLASTFLLSFPLALTVLPATAQTPAPQVTPVQTNEQATEQPPILKASQVLRPEIYKGPHHVIEEDIPTAGFLNQYTIISDFGAFKVKGNALLAKRVHEINAIATLQKIEKSNEFKKSLKSAAKMPIQMVEHLIDDPKATAHQIGQGAKRFINRAGEMFHRKGQKTKEEDNAFQAAIGFSKTKRQICWNLKVDPYTDNPRLQKAIDDLAWASFAGKFTVTLGMMAVPGGAGTAISGISTSSTIAESIRDNSPADLSAKNRAFLAKMGIGENLINAFLDTKDISPTHQTVIVRSLAALTQAKGRDTFLSMCLSARSEADAIFFQRIAQIMQTYNETASPIVSIFNLYGLPAVLTQNQTLVIPLELDYGSWNPKSAQLAQAIETYQIPGIVIAKRELVITGRVTPMAKQELLKHNIQLLENYYNEGVYLP